MSFLIDTDLLSILERRNAPQKLTRWVRDHEGEIFISEVSLAELQFGLEGAPESHKPSLSAWLADTRAMFAPATEPITEAILVRWKRLLADLKAARRTMTCEDSLIAATALFHDHVVATANIRHFEPSGVSLINPLE